MTVAPGRSADGMTWWQRILVGLPVLVLATFAVVATAVPAIHVRQLSILDETSHIDSVFKVPAIDRSGEKYSERTLDEVSCRGGIQQWPDWQPPPCGIPQGVPADDYAIGSGGYNTADIHPPTYYFLTAALSTAASWFVDADPVSLMRLTGGLYLAVGISLSWLLARRLGANRWTAFGACGLLVTAPNVLYMSSIVNVDASVIMVSAAFGLLVVAFWERRSAWWVLPLLAMGLTLVKLTNLGALIAASLFVVFSAATARIVASGRTVEEVWKAPSSHDDHPSAYLHWSAHLTPSVAVVRWRENSRRWWLGNGRGTIRALGLSGLMGLSAITVTLAWSRIQAARAVIPPADLWFNQQFKVDHLSLVMVGGSLLRFWEPRDLWFRWLSGRDYLISPLLMVTAAGLLALLVASWFRNRRVFPIVTAALLTMAIAAPVYVVTNYVVNGVYFDVNFRYGLSVLPFVAAAVGAGLRTRVAGAALSTLAVVGMITTLVALPW